TESGLNHDVETLGNLAIGADGLGWNRRIQVGLKDQGELELRYGSDDQGVEQPAVHAERERGRHADEGIPGDVFGARRSAKGDVEHRAGADQPKRREEERGRDRAVNERAEAKRAEVLRPTAEHGGHDETPANEEQTGDLDLVLLAIPVNEK